MKREFYRMEDEHARGDVQGIRSDLDAINDLMDPLLPGEVAVVAACTSVGKTVLTVQNFAIANAKRGKVVAHFSLEMNQSSVALRCMTANSQNTEAWHLKNYHYRKNNWDHIADNRRDPREELSIGDDLARLIERAWEWPLFIFYTPGATVAEIIATCWRIKRKYGLDLVTIDGLWLMKGERKREDDRTREVGYISRAVKSQIAGGLNVPVVLCHQLNREAVKSERPALHHLRESGDVEQDVDVALLIHRPGFLDPGKKSEDGLAEFIMAKQRTGRTGVAKGWFNASRTRFLDLAQEEAHR